MTDHNAPERNDQETNKKILQAIFHANGWMSWKHVQSVDDTKGREGKAMPSLARNCDRDKSADNEICLKGLCRQMKESHLTKKESLLNIWIILKHFILFHSEKIPYFKEKGVVHTISGHNRHSLKSS